MTKHLQECLEFCPKGVWFKPIDVYPRVRRASYVLNKLQDAGKLEAKIDMSPDHQTEKSYRVIEETFNDFVSGMGEVITVEPLQQLLTELEALKQLPDDTTASYIKGQLSESLERYFAKRN